MDSRQNLSSKMRRKNREKKKCRKQEVSLSDKDNLNAERTAGHPSQASRIDHFRKRRVCQRRATNVLISEPPPFHTSFPRADGAATYIGSSGTFASTRKHYVPTAPGTWPITEAADGRRDNLAAAERAPALTNHDVSARFVRYFCIAPALHGIITAILPAVGYRMSMCTMFNFGAGNQILFISGQ